MVDAIFIFTQTICDRISFENIPFAKYICNHNSLDCTFSYTSLLDCILFFITGHHIHHYWTIYYFSAIVHFVSKAVLHNSAVHIFSTFITWFYIIFARIPTIFLRLYIIFGRISIILYLTQNIVKSYSKKDIENHQERNISPYLEYRLFVLKKTTIYSAGKERKKNPHATLSFKERRSKSMSNNFLFILNIDCLFRKSVMYIDLINHTKQTELS